MTTDDVVAAIGQLYDLILTSDAPCERDAVCGVLAVLNGAILCGDEVGLENAVHAWAVAKYPEVYARWKASLS